MPLTALLHKQKQGIRDFVSDATCNLLQLVVPAGGQLIAAKVLASMQGDTDADEVYFCVEGPFESEEAFYEKAYTAVTSNLNEHRAELVASGVAIDLSDFDAPLQHPFDAAKELVFAEFAETLVRTLGDHCRALVLVVILDPSSAPDAGNWLKRLAATAQPATVKIIVISALASLGESATLPPTSRVATARAAGTDSLNLPQLVRDFLRAPLRRVLVLAELPRSSSAPESLERSIRQAGHHGRLVLCAEAGRDHPPLFEELLDDARVRSGARPLTVPALRSAAARFTAVAETTAKRHGGITVYLILVSTRDATAATSAREFVRALSSCACSSQVRYVIADCDGSADAWDFAEPPNISRTQKLALDSEAIEESLKAQIETTNLSCEERVRALGALAAFSAARGEHEVALGHQLEATNLSDQTCTPTEQSMAYFSLGTTLYAMKRWDMAELAYSNALGRALDARFHGIVPQCFTNLAHTLLSSGRCPEAIACYRSAIEWSDRVQAHGMSCYAQTWLGETYNRLGEQAAAEQTWREALEHYRSLGPALADVRRQGEAEIRERLSRLGVETTADHAHDEHGNGPLPGAYVPEQP